MHSIVCRSMSMPELEEFILSDTKDQLVKTWLESGIESKQYLALMFTLNKKGINGLSDKEKDLIKMWSEQRRYGEHLNPVLKYCLAMIESEKNTTKKKELMLEFNKQFMHFSYNDERIRKGVIEQPVPQNDSIKNQTKRDIIFRDQGKSSLTAEELKELSTAELIKNIQEDESWYNFEVETANLSFLKKIDLTKVPVASRIAAILNRFSDFGYNKVRFSHLEYLQCVKMVEKAAKKRP